MSVSYFLPKEFLVIKQKLIWDYYFLHSLISLIYLCEIGSKTNIFYDNICFSHQQRMARSGSKL